MPIIRLLLFIAVAGLVSLTFQACQKEEGRPETAQTTVEEETGDCPSMAAEIAHLEESDSIRIQQLLRHFTAAQIADLRAGTCLTKDPMDDAARSGEEVADRASGLKNRYWTPGQEIRVRFLNGSAALQNKTFGYAREWEYYANIQVKKVTSGASEVRVKFSDDGHWSYIGIDNRNIEAVPASLTTDGSSIPWNTQLSAADKGFIGMMYSSQHIRIRHAFTGYKVSISFLLDGIYYPIQPGETLQVPAYTSETQLFIREQGASGWCGTVPTSLYMGKITRSCGSARPTT